MNFPKLNTPDQNPEHYQHPEAPLRAPSQRYYSAWITHAQFCRQIDSLSLSIVHLKIIHWTPPICEALC